MGIERWSVIPASNNSAPPNGWPEGQAPSTVNDCARQMMADIRTKWQDAEWFNWGHAPTRLSNTTFKIATDVSAIYPEDRRVKLYDTTTLYASIVSAIYSAPDTTITLTMDSGAMSSSLSSVAVSIISPTNTSIPSNIVATGDRITKEITQNTHGFAVKDVLRFNGTIYAKAQADSAANSEVVGIVYEVADVNTFTLLMSGKLSGATSLTAGTVYFLSPSSAGTLTDTAPSTAGQVNKPLLVADSTTSGYFINYRGTVITTASTLVAASQSEMETESATAGLFVGPSVVKYSPGTAKAWIKWNGTGTVAINASYNVTSITDNGSGDTTITIANDFSSADYSAVGGPVFFDNGGATVSGTLLQTRRTPADQAVGSFRVISATVANTAIDCIINFMTFFGDQ
jgi:hypothetical protein